MAVSGDDGGSVKIWSVANGRLLRNFTGHAGGAVRSLAFTPDGSSVLFAGADLKLWRLTSERELGSFPASSITSIAMSPRIAIAISGDSRGVITLWRLGLLPGSIGDALRVLPGHSGPVTALAFSPFGLSVLSGSSDDTVRLRNTGSGSDLAIFPHIHDVRAVAFSSDGWTILVAHGHSVTLLDIGSGRLLRTFSGLPTDINCFAFSPDGKRLLTGSSYGTVRLWDLKDGRELRTFAGHSGLVTALVFSPCSDTALSGGADGTIRLWELDSGREIRTLTERASRQAKKLRRKHRRNPRSAIRPAVRSPCSRALPGGMSVWML